MTAERESLRQSYVDALVAEAALRDDFVVLEADAAGATFVRQFIDRYPDRHIACGVAEQQMIGTAAGLATTGVIPIANTMAVFGCLRALEQLRTSVAYPRFNVKLALSHVGIDVGEDGPTQAAIEDLGVMGSIPNLVILSPVDRVEMRQMVHFMLRHEGPVYLRTGRSPVPQVLPDDHVYRPGHWPTVREGTDVTIVAIGIMVHIALEACRLLAADGVSAACVNASTFKPVDGASFVARAALTGAVVTAEDHNVRGGLGSLVSELLAAAYPLPVERVGLQDRFAESGRAALLFEKYGLTPASIAAAAHRAIARKAS
jgi:transketolase